MPRGSTEEEKTGFARRDFKSAKNIQTAMTPKHANCEVEVRGIARSAVQKMMSNRVTQMDENINLLTPTLVRVPPRINSRNNNANTPAAFQPYPPLSPTYAAPASSPAFDDSLPLNIELWDIDHVAHWLELCGFSKLKSVFTENDITGELLLELDYSLLSELGLSKTTEKARLLQAIKSTKKKQIDLLNNEQSPQVNILGNYLIPSPISGNSQQSFSGLGTSPSRLNPSSYWKPLTRSPQQQYQQLFVDNDQSLHSGGLVLSRMGSNSSFREPNQTSPSQPQSTSSPRKLNQDSATQSSSKSLEPLAINIAPRSFSLKNTNSTQNLRQQYMDAERSQYTTDIYSRNPNETNSVSSGSPSPKPQSPNSEILFEVINRFTTGNIEKPNESSKMDIMNDEKIRAKCIRVSGTDNQVHIISVEGINSVDTLRNRIYKKFNVMGELERKKYAIFVGERTSDGTEKRPRRLDDETLLQICLGNSEMKSHLILRKEFRYGEDLHQQQLQKMSEMLGREAASQAENVMTGKEPSLNIELKSNISNRFNDGIIEDIMGMKANTDKLKALRPAKSPQTQKQFKISKFFKEDVNSGKGKEIKKSGAIQTRIASLPRNKNKNIQIDEEMKISNDRFSSTSAASRNSKKSMIFGERPSDLLIADQLEQYFEIDPADAANLLTSKSTSPAPSPAASPKPLPQLPDSIHIQQLQSAQAATSISNLPLPYASYTPSSSTPTIQNTKILKERVRAATSHKRMSKVVNRQSIYSQYRARNNSMMSSSEITSNSASTSIERKTSIQQHQKHLLRQLEMDMKTPPPNFPLPPSPTTSFAGSVGSFVLEYAIPSTPPPTPISFTIGTPQPTPAAEPEIFITETEDSGTHPETSDTVYEPNSRSSSTYIPALTIADANQEVSVEVEPETTEESLRHSIRWTQGKLIGQGAFGKVYHALNLETCEIMAVKQVILGPRDGAADVVAMRKRREDALNLEIEMLSDLKHENIVRYLGFEVKDHMFNVFLEYVDGGSIASCLAKFGRFEEDFTISLTFQILHGLEYLHSRKIIHRDIKGANILIDTDGVAKISDFGISKKNQYDVAYQRMTRMSMQGSIYWMAPEVALGKGYSAKVDIWSLGCIVLEMLTGHHPWHKVRGNIIYLLGTGNSPPLPDILSENSRNFLGKCFTVDPEKRPTATELLTDPFVQIDLDSFDFSEWFQRAQKEAELRSQQQNIQGSLRRKKQMNTTGSDLTGTDYGPGETGIYSDDNEEMFEESELGEMDLWVDVDDDEVDEIDEVESEVEEISLLSNDNEGKDGEESTDEILVEEDP
ncbi:hypothetical protein HK096_010520 [Nowakowskiella sp. JEL0078]|nr:hypothetical protein HK096_010520 [Nowakowskiella sp. JEL0078]